MLEGGLDQAAGLRTRAAPPLGLMAFPLPPHGAQPWIAQIAHALCALGRRPLVVDAARGAVVRAFNMRPRHDLLDLLEGRLEFDDVAVGTPDGVWVLGADRGVEAFAASGESPARLLGAFSRLQRNFDDLLLAMPADELACLADPEEAVPVVSLFPGAGGMVQAYGTVKQLAEGFGFRRFACVVHGAEHEPEARADHARLAGAAQRFLGAEVRLAGSLHAQGVFPLRLVAQQLLETAATPLH